MDKLLYDKGEAAALLGVKVSAVNWLVRTGKLPYRKIARKIRFTLSDLDVLIAHASCGCAALAEKKRKDGEV